MVEKKSTGEARGGEKAAKGRKGISGSGRQTAEGRRARLDRQKIVFFATAWGTRYGGINSFNFDICRALAKLVKGKYEVVCVVPCAKRKQLKEAQGEGVKLVALRDTGDESRFLPEDTEEVKKLFPVSTKDEVLWWIGHDVKTGPIATKAAKVTGMGQIALFHHMNYQSYLAAIPIDTQEPITGQRKVLRQADIVFAIGPKLARSARDMVRPKPADTVQELIPGLHDIEGVNAPDNFSAIVFGRLTGRTDCVKQSRLAVAAFSHASLSGKNHKKPLGPESSLMVVGLPDGDEGESEREQLKDLSFKKAKRKVQIHPWSYFEDRDQLFEELRLKSVCLLTSIYEGFGLAGWEAISAEVPLITTTNSGLYEFIKRHFALISAACIKGIEIKGSSREDYSEEDVENLAEAIMMIRDEIEEAKKCASILKKMLQRVCTWENCALSLAKALGIVTEKPQDEELYSESMEDQICRLCGFSKEQLHEMYDNVRRFYGF